MSTPNGPPPSETSQSTASSTWGRGLTWALLAVTSLAVAACGAVTINDPEHMSSARFQKGAETADYDHGADYVWLHIKETVAHLSTRQPKFNDDTLRAFATVEDGSIQVGVIRLGDDHCRMAVRARQYGLPNESLARTVLERLHQEIEP